MPNRRAAPLWQSGLRCRCPRCGEGRLYSGYLKFADGCSLCQLDYRIADAGDGPAVFVVLIAGALIAAAAAFVEITFQPPYWMHALIWLPATVGLCLALLPPFKATLFALQYRHNAGEHRSLD
jgi:uncharacterized protein (DUF983 family)